MQSSGDSGSVSDGDGALLAARLREHFGGGTKRVADPDCEAPQPLRKRCSAASSDELTPVLEDPYGSATGECAVAEKPTPLSSYGVAGG